MDQHEHRPEERRGTQPRHQGRFFSLPHFLLHALPPGRTPLHRERLPYLPYRLPLRERPVGAPSRRTASPAWSGETTISKNAPVFPPGLFCIADVSRAATIPDDEHGHLSPARGSRSDPSRQLRGIRRLRLTRDPLRRGLRMGMDTQPLVPLRPPGSHSPRRHTGMAWDHLPAHHFGKPPPGKRRRLHLRRQLHRPLATQSTLLPSHPLGLRPLLHPIRHGRAVQLDEIPATPLRSALAAAP